MLSLFRLFSRRALPLPLLPHPFDFTYGTDTSGLIPPEQLRSHHPQSHASSAYYAMSPSRFRAAISRWLQSAPPHPLGDYTFLDLGCGKGRALLLATELPFREAIGIELHRGLARTARRNLSLWRAGSSSAQCSARILRGDATAVRLPPGPCLLYLFHPFAAPAMARLISHLRCTLRARASGPLDIIYFNPEAGGLWVTEPGVRQLWSEVLPMTPEDAAADPIANPDDRCDGYRWQLPIPVSTTDGRFGHGPSDTELL